MADHDAMQHVATTRLEAFSDGVFAIAITLLIIEIGVPHVTEGESLASALRDLWPSYIGYVLSFVTIGIMWMNHHELFRDIERTDHGVVVLNLLLLMTVSFLPFPTAVFADYINDADHRTEAMLAYSGTFFFIALAHNALWFYVARRRELLDDHVTEERIRTRSRRYIWGPVAYGSMVPLALISPWISFGIAGGLALFYLLPLTTPALGVATDRGGD